MSKSKEEFIDAGNAETEEYQPTEEVRQEFEDAQRLAAGGDQLKRELREHNSRTPELSGGDVDADWARADVGDHQQRPQGLLARHHQFLFDRPRG